MKLLIANGYVIDPSQAVNTGRDLLIDDGRVVGLLERGEPAPKNVAVLDATGLIVAPGFIDMHTHLREPGQTSKETIETGTRAAARGGFTSVCAMPNTKPVNDERAVTEFILALAGRKAVVNVYPIGALTKGLLGWEVTDMADLVAAGAIAFSDDGRCVQDNRVMRRALETAKSLGALVIDHCEDRPLSEGGVIHEGAMSRRLGLPGIPAAAEDIMVARDIILAEALETPVHLAHLSTGGAAHLVREAKSRGVGISAEVTPHHLVLDDRNLEKREPVFKVNPPLRSPEDVRALIAAVKDGTVDVFRPYTHHADFSCMGRHEGSSSVICYIGTEVVKDIRPDRLALLRKCKPLR